MSDIVRMHGSTSTVKNPTTGTAVSQQAVAIGGITTITVERALDYSQLIQQT